MANENQSFVDMFAMHKEFFVGGLIVVGDGYHSIYQLIYTWWRTFLAPDYYLNQWWRIGTTFSNNL